MTDSRTTPAVGLSGRQIAAVVAGNGLEFYDFLTYSFFAAQIGEALFPGCGPTSLGSETRVAYQADYYFYRRR
jgi:hypothetical protein